MNGRVVVNHYLVDLMLNLLEYLVEPTLPKVLHFMLFCLLQLDMSSLVTNWRCQKWWRNRKYNKIDYK